MEVEGRESMVFRDGERRQYEESKKVFWDNYSVMKTAHDKGMAKGLAEGRAEGIAEGIAEGLAKGKMDNARKMKADNMPTDLIAKYTGLTIEEIEAL